MTTQDGTERKPLWLLIEETFLEHGPQAFEGQSLEGTIGKVAQDLDNTGHNVSRHGGNLLQLRWAAKEMLKVGRPLMKDFNEAVAALELSDVTDPRAAAGKLIAGVGETWPSLKRSERKPDILEIVEATRLELLTAKAKGLSGDEGIRLLIVEGYLSEVVTAALEITEEKFAEVNATVEAERAERERVIALLGEKENDADESKVKFLIENNVAENLIVELSGIDQGVVDGVKKAMEEELKEKQRLADEEAARKAEEAAGPSLDSIPDDEMVDYIESIREILEFSDQETEIRAMCDQSSIPTSLVDLAVSDPDKLDELEEKAGG
jgi:hypothetical protein